MVPLGTSRVSKRTDNRRHPPAYAFYEDRQETVWTERLSDLEAHRKRNIRSGVSSPEKRYAADICDESPVQEGDNSEERSCTYAWRAKHSRANGHVRFCVHCRPQVLIPDPHGPLPSNRLHVW